LGALEDLNHYIVPTFGLEGEELKAAREKLIDGWLSVYVRGLGQLLDRGGNDYFADKRLTIADLKAFVQCRRTSSSDWRQTWSNTRTVSATIHKSQRTTRLAEHMHLSRILAATVVACSLTACSATEPDNEPDAGTAFHALLDEHWAAATAEKIFFRTDPDAWRMDGTRQQFNEQVLTRLADIRIEDLDADDQISYRVFRYERETERESYQQPDHFFPITSLFGYHTYFAESPSNSTFLSADDYDDYLISLADFTRYNRDYIQNMRAAIEAGYTHYCESIADYGRTIEAHIVADAEQSQLYVPFNRGITSLPGGDDYYRYLINYYTTTNLTPAEIHELGRTELGRIRDEMQEVIDAVGFDGGFREFIDFLREDDRFYARTDQELLGRAALISKTAEGELPRFFTRLPRAPYKIVGDPNRGAFYVAPSGDGTDSGTYFLQIGDLRSTPLYTLEALSLHEAVPGHHLQSTLAQELNVPEFRRDLYHSAFGEGWGLYSERLGKEMGFYRDSYSEFGRLTYDAWRAGRLVVDTGMHAFGWSRQQGRCRYRQGNRSVHHLASPGIVVQDR
jgi:uncharacterized protein (DUF885 family)